MSPEVVGGDDGGTRLGRDDESRPLGGQRHSLPEIGVGYRDRGFLTVSDCRRDRLVVFQVGRADKNGRPSLTTAGEGIEREGVRW